MNYNEILNEIKDMRSKNNNNWMDILKLAFKYAPEEATEIMKKVTNYDKEISKLCEKLTKDNL